MIRQLLLFAKRSKLTQLSVILCSGVILTSCLKTLQKSPQALDGVSESQVKSSQKDNFLWLEKVEGSRALSWVKNQNDRTLEDLTKDPNYKNFLAQAEQIVNSQDRLVTGRVRGEYIYNFWQDEKNTRGLWRRMKFADYRKKRRHAAEAWEVILDIDKLSKDEGENWVYKSVSCLPTDANICLLRLSRGGTDASVYREFNIAEKAFVKDGFNSPEGKNRFGWVDKDTIYIGADVGKGALTDSGYPRKVRLWKRGQKISDAEVVHEANKDAVSVFAFKTFGSSGDHRILGTSLSFYETELYYVNPETLQKSLLTIPKDAEVQDIHKNQMVLLLRSDWSTGQGSFSQGSLVSVDLERFKKDGSVRVQSLYAPNKNTAMQRVYASKNAIYITVLENVKSKILRAQYSGGAWRKAFMKTRKNGRLRILSANSNSDDILFTFEGFITPSQLYWAKDTRLSGQLIASAPARFNSSGLRVKQRFAKSKDGTRIPYYVVSKKRLNRYGENMTLLYGYGGFEISMTPRYNPILGKLWLERGGVYVLANIRGGGEFGPRWHQAAQKENRQKGFDDFAAVAKDLMMKNITTSNNLGVRGGSNGGLLTGVMLVQNPRLLNAVVSTVPLLDMLRFNKLLAGASWVGEYGNPDKQSDREFLAAYSPYQNLRNNRMYPKPFFLTSTKDDRVHPGHARKMAAKMNSFGHQVYYYENTEGGHSASANRLQTAKREALIYTYLHKRLKPVEK